MLDHHHESHRPISFFFRIGSWLLPTVSVESRTSSTSTSNNRLQNRHGTDYFFCATCLRCRASCSRSSGVSSGPKSFASNTCRISISDSPGIGFGQRLTHSTASSIDLTCHSQNPAINSLVSVNGPSITLRFVPENRTRLPFELGCSPSAASSTPAFTNSSLNFPISVRSSWLGMTPASESFVAFTITMHRIVLSPYYFYDNLYFNVESPSVRSTNSQSFFGSASPSSPKPSRANTFPTITSSNGQAEINTCLRKICRNRW